MRLTLKTTTMNILDISEWNQQRAREVIDEARIIPIWESIGAEINLVGSLKTGLLMKHLDIDFHIYTSPFSLSDSFQAMMKLAENKSIVKMERVNLLDSADACMEWHAWYRDAKNELWQIDMIHIMKGSRYDGYFEKFAERLSAVLTEETRLAILQLKYDTPDTEKIMGIEYYQSVIRDGIRTYADFMEWRKQHPVTGIVEWMP